MPPQTAAIVSSSTSTSTSSQIPDPPTETIPATPYQSPTGSIGFTQTHSPQKQPSISRQFQQVEDEARLMQERANAGFKTTTSLFNVKK
jgi:hypothetical protein